MGWKTKKILLRGKRERKGEKYKEMHNMKHLNRVVPWFVGSFERKTTEEKGQGHTL